MDNDDASIEGAVARDLFRTESDTDEDDGPEVGGHHELHPQGDSGILPGDKTQSLDVFVERQVMGITLAEQQVGGSIAQRLWPAAEYLADFVLCHSPQHESCSLGHSEELKEAKEAGAMFSTLAELVSPRDPKGALHVLELGAGVGLTGLQVATQLPCRVLLTDLDEAIPLLERNIKLNRAKFEFGGDAVTSQVLSWGNTSDCEDALRWLPNDERILILAADCVYFKELQIPLEQTLAALLSQAPEGSLCLIAGARRWKSDNSFYAKLGQRTRTATHQLSCVCLKETVSRDASGRRDVLRVFGVQWRTNQALKERA
jgi:Lysine methyltransferase